MKCFTLLLLRVRFFADFLGYSKFSVEIGSYVTIKESADLSAKESV